MATAHIHGLQDHVQENGIVGERLALAYRDLIGDEARLGETLSRRGVRIGATLADQWSTLDEYLSLYARGLSPAGMVVFGGRPDDGSRGTGIPFTGGPEARERLGLQSRAPSASPSGAAFWRAVDLARAQTPIESVLGSIHLAHAQPFDFAPAPRAPGTETILAAAADEPEVREASAAHVLRILDATRPQAIVCIGADALATLGRALRNPTIVDVASTRETAWTQRWPPGTRLSTYPYAEVPCARPYRARIVPVPSLVGPASATGQSVLVSAFSYVLA